MKLKHVLLTGALSIVAAVMLLTLVPPQTAQAAPGVYTWVVDYGEYGQYTIDLTRKDASDRCSWYGVLSVTKLGSTHNICH